MEGRLFFNAYYIACGKIYRLALWASALSTGGVAAHPDINSSPPNYGSVAQRQRQQTQNLFSMSSNLITPTNRLSRSKRYHGFWLLNYHRRESDMWHSGKRYIRTQSKQPFPFFEP